MKKLFILTAIITSILIATKGYSQVYIGARVGFRHAGIGFPVVRRPFIAPAPVVYGGYVAPAPVYAGGYYAAPGIYRPFFERDHRAYFNRGGFDRARFAHDRGFHRGRK